jgi:hypothetical protein
VGGVREIAVEKLLCTDIKEELLKTSKKEKDRVEKKLCMEPSNISILQLFKLNLPHQILDISQ